MLETTGDRVAEAREAAARAGNGLNLIPDIACCRVELNQEPLLALFDMHCGG